MSNDLPKMAVGIDVGSLNARVAVVSSSSSSSSSVKVVSNTLGHRSTTATVVKEEDHVVMGEAAHRLLVKQKLSVQDHMIHHYLLRDTEPDLVASFMGHLASLASDATSVQTSQLRVTLSVPVDASEEFVDSLVERTKQGIKTLMKQANQKKKIKDKIVVGVVTDAAAVCVAHGLTDKNNNDTNKKNILVVDWGASGLTLTSLEFMGTSNILSVTSTTREESLSGHVLVEVFAKHVASQFERKNRFPSGEVWQSYKARTKLLGACEAALQSMTSNGSGNSTVHVTIDGLFEGIDCHVGVSRPRWDMLTSPLMTKARALLEKTATPDVVLVAGSVGLMPSVQQLMEKVFENVNRGLSNISPDEAVALGCARHAALAVELLDASDKRAPMLPMISNISVSPIELGLKKESDDNIITLVGKGTPLPAHVTHTFKCQSGESYGLWQLTPTNKLVARLEDLPSNGEDVELLLELSTKGALSLAVQGGALVRIE